QSEQRGAGDCRMMTPRREGTLNPNCDCGRNGREWHDGDHLLENCRAGPTLDPELMVEMGRQDTRTVRELLSLGGDCSDMCDVAEAVDAVNAKRRHTQQRGASRIATARDHEGRQGECWIYLRGSPNQYEDRAYDSGRAWEYAPQKNRDSYDREQRDIHVCALHGKHDCRRTRCERQHDASSGRDPANEKGERPENHRNQGRGQDEGVRLVEAEHAQQEPGTQIHQRPMPRVAWTLVKGIVAKPLAFPGGGHI